MSKLKSVKKEPPLVIIVRVGEIFLKGKNRGVFDKILLGNIKRTLSLITCDILYDRNRFIISNFTYEDSEIIVDKLKKIFGIHSISVGKKIDSKYTAICKAVLSYVPKEGSFRITANRADKTFKFNSMELARELGGFVLSKRKKQVVNLHTPDTEIFVDIRERGYTFVFSSRIFGVGGMPVGSSGKGLLLLSGGIDSPVAGYFMAKRGLMVDALHFHSYPYTSDEAKKKVVKLRDTLEKYCIKMPLLCVPFTKIQEAIIQYCHPSFTIAIMRRIMNMIAVRVAIDRGAGCLINGECLAQVASQTMQSLTASNDAAGDFLILRPLIGFDKNEIIEVAKRIETYDISIEPFEDCCTAFVPDKPIIKPKLEVCQAETVKIPNLEDLIQEAIANIERL